MTLPTWMLKQGSAYANSVALSSLVSGKSVLVVHSGDATSSMSPTCGDSIVGGYTLLGRWTCHNPSGHGGAGGDTGIALFIYPVHPGGSPTITIASPYVDGAMDAFQIDGLDTWTPLNAATLRIVS